MQKMLYNPFNGLPRSQLALDADPFGRNLMHMQGFVSKQPKPKPLILDYNVNEVLKPPAQQNMHPVPPWTRIEGDGIPKDYLLDEKISVSAFVAPWQQVGFMGFSGSHGGPKGVTITHVETGTSVSYAGERSVYRNRAVAWHTVCKLVKDLRDAK